MPTDTRGFDRQCDQLRSRFSAGAVILSKEIAHAAATAMFVTVGADTNRIRRGIAEANNAAGLTSMPVPPIVPSRYVGQYRDRLNAQVDRVRKQLAAVEKELGATEGKMQRWYQDKGREPDKFYRVLQRAAAKLYTRRQRLLDVLEVARLEREQLTDTAILIGGRKRKSGKDIGVSNLATLRTSVYGGSGRIYEAAGQVLVELRILEPHASIADSKFKFVAAGRAAARAMNGTRLDKLASQVLNRSA